jgi:hypothetical protein
MTPYAATSVPETSATVERQAGSSSTRRRRVVRPTTNQRKSSMPMAAVASAAPIHAVVPLRKNSAASSPEASKPGSPNVEMAMMGAKSRTTATRATRPVVRARLRHRSRLRVIKGSVTARSLPMQAVGRSDPVWRGSPRFGEVERRRI